MPNKSQTPILHESVNYCLQCQQVVAKAETFPCCSKCGKPVCGRSLEDRGAL